MITGFRFAIATLACFYSSSQTASARCWFDGTILDYRIPVITSPMTVNSEGCNHGFFNNKEATLKSAALVVRPKHGEAGQFGPFEFGYRPNKGYVGADSYELRVCAALVDGKHRCSRLIYKVNAI